MKKELFLCERNKVFLHPSQGQVLNFAPSLKEKVKTGREAICVRVSAWTGWCRGGGEETWLKVNQPEPARTQRHGPRELIMHRRRLRIVPGKKKKEKKKSQAIANARFAGRSALFSLFPFSLSNFFFFFFLSLFFGSGGVVFCLCRIEPG